MPYLVRHTKRAQISNYYPAREKRKIPISHSTNQIIITLIRYLPASTTPEYRLSAVINEMREKKIKLSSAAARAPIPIYLPSIHRTKPTTRASHDKHRYARTDRPLNDSECTGSDEMSYFTLCPIRSSCCDRAESRATATAWCHGARWATSPRVNEGK